jgi:predicted metal-dependent phosphoesterase TrpH
MFLYETHLHTSETSVCGCSTAVEMVNAYKQKGFAGMVITDHFVNGYSYSAQPERWEDKIAAFLKGYNAARKEGDRIGIQVFLGWEFTYIGNGEDYLTYGLDEAFLYENRDCGTWEINRYAEAVHKSGGILIRAHPYRVADYIRNPCAIRPNIADVIEVFNGGNGDNSFNDKALQYATENSMPMSSGSDAHHVDSTALGYVGFNRKMGSSRDLGRGLIQKEAKLFRKPY